MKKNTFIIILGRIIQIAITLISLRVMTNILNEKDLGYYYILNSTCMFASLFILNPVGQYLNRYTVRWNFENKLYDKFMKLLVFYIIGSIFYSMVMFLLSKIGFFKYDFLICGIIFLFLFSLSANQILIYTFNLIDEKIIFSVMISMTALLTLIFSFLLVDFDFLKLDRAVQWMLGMIISNSSVLFIGCFFLRKNNHLVTNDTNFSNRERVSDIIKFSLPLAFSTIFIWFLNSGYRFFIENQMGLIYLGGLGVAFGLVIQIMSVVESLVTQILQPDLYQKFDLNNNINKDKIISEYITETISIYFIVALFVTVSIKPIFLILVNPDFLKFYYLGLFAVWFEFFRASSNSLGIIAMLDKKTKILIYPYMISSLFLIFLFFISDFFSEYLDKVYLLPLFILLSGAVSFILMLLIISRRYKFKIYFSIFMKRIFFIIPAMSMFFLYPNVEIIGFKMIMILFISSALFLIMFFLSINKKKSLMRLNK